MIADKLQMHYQHSVEWQTPGIHHRDYAWFLIEGKKVGIPKERLTEEEFRLLSTLFPATEAATQNGSYSQEKWQRFFFENDNLPLNNWQSIRFIHFHASSAISSVQEFEQAFLSLFSEDALLIWESATDGFIIDNLKTEEIPLEEIQQVIQILESDFYVQLSVYVGSFQPMDEHLRLHRRTENHIFLRTLHDTGQKINTAKNIFPYMLIKGIQGEEEWYCRELLGSTADDADLLKTVQTYIRLNQNATMAAKVLYIHRNSLQYRIDKFIEKTGLDVRTFHDAMIAHLVLLLK
ncbi:MAG: PucR family transcriptional regulator [Bacillus sp. (in: firmicutes)]